MNWRSDPRVQKLLEKATLESLLKRFFKRIYGAKQANEMESTLQKALHKYDQKECSCEMVLKNDETSAEPLIDVLLETLCDKNFNGRKKHTPGTVLALAHFFFKVGDFRVASELIWCSATLALQEFVEHNHLKIRLHSHNCKRHFANALSRDIGIMFFIFEGCHSSFYSDRYCASDVKLALEEATLFLQKLKDFTMTAELKKELEAKDFYA